jgi:peptidoglycan/LPS O-acetylase OafA/YrhL
LGALIYRYKDFLKPLFRNSAMLILCLFGCYFFRRVNPAWRFDVGYTAFAPALVESIFAAGVVLSAASRPIKMLRGTSLAWLGNISYSLYLFHFTLMSVLAKCLGKASLPLNVRAIVLMVGTLVVALLVAHLSFEYIEKPGIAAGKKLINLVTAKFPVQR